VGNEEIENRAASIKNNRQTVVGIPSESCSFPKESHDLVSAGQYTTGNSRRNVKMHRQGPGSTSPVQGRYTAKLRDYSRVVQTHTNQTPGKKP
jgi:hypothetical protein